MLAITGFLWSCGGASEQAETETASADLVIFAKEEVDITGEGADLPLDKLTLPEGFSIEVFAGNVPDARSLALGDKGTVFVGNRRQKKVYALVDSDGDGKADKRYTLASDLNMPNGVAFRDGDLYVAEVNRILRFPDIESNLESPGFEIIYDQYPTETHHGWKFIAFGPDGKLYVPVGAPCNICESEDEIYASITTIDVDADNPTPTVFAHGVRNTVGFTWHPTTNKLWFTDNGRDMMGNDTPECELNYAPEAGMHFGYPYWHQGDVKDPEFGDKRPNSEDFTAPAAKMGPHVAPLGLRFYTGSSFPATYQNNLFIAKHGSWNRDEKSGYQVTTVALDGTDKVASEKVFIEGWLDKASQENWGRPVDVMVMPDGSMLLSDDQAGCVYRITYKG